MKTCYCCDADLTDKVSYSTCIRDKKICSACAEKARKGSQGVRSWRTETSKKTRKDYRSGVKLKAFQGGQF